MSDADDGARTSGESDTAEEPLRRRVVEQFSGAGERAAIWRGFERFLPTREYLNLGYSPWYLPTVVGDSQARLADRLADGLVDRLADGLADRRDDEAGTRLLDLGSGRGGPARQFAGRGFDVTGLDLVPYNVSLARANARSDVDGARRGASWRNPPQFLVGDATALPFEDDAFAACVAVDSLVYVPDQADAFAEAARVLVDGGWFATADLLADDDAPPGAGGPLEEFASAWDTAPIAGVDAYLDGLRAAGFTVETVEDVTPNSVGRFRKWSWLFLALARGPTAGPVRALLRHWGVDPDAAIAQVRAAHEALAHLRHVIVYARVSGDGTS